MPRSRRASGRPKRQIQLPATYSKEYPVKDGHNYLVRSIPRDVWVAVRKRATSEERAIRVVVIRALELYASGRLQI